jgi:hypothetical protein
MRVRAKTGIAVGVGLLTLFVLCLSTMAADPIVGQWNYTTSNHWAKGPVPTGRPSQGIVVITQAGNQLKMEFTSGMVFNPPELRYFTGRKEGQGYVFSNRAQVDDEGGVARNTCNLKMSGASHCRGKSYAEYNNSGITFSWGFDIVLTR